MAEKEDFVLIYRDKIWLLHDTPDEARRAAKAVIHYPEITLRAPFREFRGAIDTGFDMKDGAYVIRLDSAEHFTEVRS